MADTILVTGGAGFIGSHLCERLLTLGHKVLNLDNFNDYYDSKIKEQNIKKALQHENYRLYRGDIRDNAILLDIFSSYEIQHVIHLAAMAGIRNSLKDPLEYIDVDIKGTVNLLENARKCNVSKFVFASSSSVYGINSKVPFSESDQVELQISPYATAKRAGELYCKTYHHLYGMSIACLRFFTVYGSRQRPEMAIHSFTGLIDKGKEIPVFGDGSSRRDYTYIDDIIDGILASMTVEYGFEIFNLGNSETITLRELISLIEKMIGKEAEIKFLPEQKGDVPITYADVSYSNSKLKYNPKVKIEEGIKRFVKWYKDHY